jgi:hypothetical protein
MRYLWKFVFTRIFGDEPVERGVYKMSRGLNIVVHVTYGFLQRPL